MRLRAALVALAPLSPACKKAARNRQQRIAKSRAVNGRRPGCGDKSGVKPDPGVHLRLFGGGTRTGLACFDVSRFYPALLRQFVLGSR